MASKSGLERFVFLLILCSFIINPILASYDQLRKREISQPAGSANSNYHCNGITEEHVVCPVGKGNTGVCSGHGECNCSHGFCNCFPDWAGSSCEYHASILNCDSLRSCVQCKVHGTGPLADDDNGCEYFCKDYPRVIAVNNFYVQSHETLCSYIDDSSDRCRFLFKVENFPSLRGTNGIEGNADVYIIAKLTMDCHKPGNPKKFPIIKNEGNDTGTGNNKMISSHQIMEHIRDEEEKKQSGLSGYVTPIVLLMFILLPTAACVFSFIFNVPRLPCGLCNKFRRPSSAYLRNPRPYPGSIEDNNIIYDL